MDLNSIKLKLSSFIEKYYFTNISNVVSFTQFKKELTGLTNRNCTISFRTAFAVHNSHRTPQAVVLDYI